MRLINYIRRTNPTIIHSFMQTPNFWARIAGKLGGCPIVITSIRNSKIQLSFLEKHMSKYCSKIIVNSDLTKINLVNLGAEPAKIHLIYNGVDINRFKPKPKARKIKLKFNNSISVDQKVFSFVGKFERQKNHNP